MKGVFVKELSPSLGSAPLLYSCCQGERLDGICYLTKEEGGTFYTVNYARKANIPLVNVAGKV